MDEQMAALIELQEVDARIQAQKREKDRLPELLARLEQQRTAGREALDQVKTSLEEAQKKKRDRDRDLETEAQKVEKLKARTGEIKTNKEYQALLKEIETVEQANKAIEDDIISLMEKIDEATARIAEADQRVREEEAAIAAEQKKHEAAFAMLEQEITAQEKARQEIAGRVDSVLRARYESLLVTKGGLAVAEARGESCSGCRMTIPPKLFVSIKKGDGINECPHCYRLLYFKEMIVQQ